MSEDLAQTRARLLEAAGEVFADVGYRGATVRDICTRAGTNVAAVNYHFRSKEELYRAVFHHSHAMAMAKSPPPEVGVGRAEDRLREFVLRTLERMLDTGRPAWHGKLMAMEMADPSGLVEELADRYMRPQFQMLCGIIRELLGPGAPREKEYMLALSTVGQCLFYKTGRPVIARVVPIDMYEPALRAAIVDHVVETVLASIAQAKRRGGPGSNGRAAKSKGRGGAR